MLAHLALDRRYGSRKLRPTGVGNHAEGAEFIAAFLHRHKCGSSITLRCFRQQVELRFFDEFKPHLRLAHLLRLSDHFRQRVITLWPHHHIDIRRAGGDFLALGLRHAACHRQQHAPPRFRKLGLMNAHPPQIGIHFLRCFFADMAGVKNHQIRIVRRVSRFIAKRLQHVAHPLRIVDVHLAAVGFNVEFFGHCPSLLRPIPTITEIMTQYRQ